MHGNVNCHMGTEFLVGQRHRALLGERRACLVVSVRVASCRGAHPSPGRRSIIRSITHAPDQTVARPHWLQWLDSISPLPRPPLSPRADLSPFAGRRPRPTRVENRLRRRRPIFIAFHGPNSVNDTKPSCKRLISNDLLDDLPQFLTCRKLDKRAGSICSVSLGRYQALDDRGGLEHLKAARPSLPPGGKAGRPPASRLLVEAGETFEEALAPFADDLARRIQARGNDVVRNRSIPGSVRWDPTRPFIPPTVTTPQ